MKKFAIFTLLSICVSAIAITSVNSQNSGVSAITNLADTTPMHHMMKKPMHDSMGMHHTMMHKKKMMKDSTM